MFTHLQITNFKTWQDSGLVTLAPVTLLLGVNSSGKSSLLQSLLLLKQTIASPDRSIHLNFGGDEISDVFNFGHFDDVLKRGASPRQFGIYFRFHRNEGMSTTEFEGEFNAHYGMTASGATVVQEVRLSGNHRCFKAIRRERGAYSLYVDHESQPRGKSRNFAPERSIALPAEAIQTLSLDGGVLEDISLAIRRELENIAYLGPLRRKPERDYMWNKTQPGELGMDGHGAIAALFASAYLRGKDYAFENCVTGVSKWLKRMELANRLEIRSLGHSTRYEILIHQNGVAANLRDVGIGVSQVLPVLTLAYFAPPGSTIILEEPEIHLHPLAQAVLAEFLIEVSQQRQIQFIVETHSEHLFRRLQTLIARTALSPEDCRLYFVERRDQQTGLRELTLDAYGRVLDWPEHFFGDALGETREQARLMFKRQQQARS